MVRSYNIVFDRTMFSVYGNKSRYLCSTPSALNIIINDDTKRTSVGRQTIDFSTPPCSIGLDASSPAGFGCFSLCTRRKGRC